MGVFKLVLATLLLAIQAGLKAMGRTHYIGQVNQVYIFWFITENSIEEQCLNAVVAESATVDLKSMPHCS